MSGKGSKQRPTDLEKFGANYDAIFRKSGPRVHDDAQAEDEAFKYIEQQTNEIKETK